MISHLSISTLSIVELCDELSDELSATMKEKDIYGQAVSIKIKSHDFKLKTKVMKRFILMKYLTTTQAIFLGQKIPYIIMLYF